MNKVICDICGTAYPETEELCPICGSSREAEMEEFLEEECLPEEEDSKEKAGLFAAGILSGGLDFAEEAFEDEVVREPRQEDEEEEDGEDESHSNPLLVVILVVLITLLLAASGYLFLRYFMPNVLMSQPTTAETVPVVSTETMPSTERKIPCVGLVLTGGVDPITMEGGYRLLHVRVSPADTTDQLVFVSENESVVIVNDDGRMTAKGEGETYVNITCGQQKLRCHVIVDYSLAESTQPLETIPPMTSPTETETMATEETRDGEETETTGTEPTEQESTALKDVVLKLKKTDISLGVGLTYTLPLDCDLSYEEIEWSVEEPYVVKVENGRVTALRKGVTDVVARYGDQVVECRIRCS